MKRGEIYPSWRYHRTEAPRLCKDAAEDAILGDAWADTPAAFVGEPEPEAGPDVLDEPSEPAIKRKPGRPRKDA